MRSGIPILRSPIVQERNSLRAELSRLPNLAFHFCVPPEKKIENILSIKKVQPGLSIVIQAFRVISCNIWLRHKFIDILVNSTDDRV